MKMPTSPIRNIRSEGGNTEEDARRAFEAEASQKATRLNYEGQILTHEGKAVGQALDAGEGTRPPQVQRANFLRGLVITVLGLFSGYTHYRLGSWALKWLKLGNITQLAALALTLSGAAGVAFLLNGIPKIFVERKHDAHTVCITFVGAAILLCSIFASAKLGYMRAGLARMGMTDQTASEVIIDGQKVRVGSQADAVSRFFEKCGPALEFIFPLMAVVLDLTSGLLLHVGLDKLISSYVALLLLRRKREIDLQLAWIAWQSDTLQAEVEKKLFDFRERQALDAQNERIASERRAYKSSPQYLRKKIAVTLAAFTLAMIVFLLLASKGWSDTVVLFDVSLSEKRPSVAKEGVLEANKKAVERIISTLEVGERFHVVAISGRSRADPWIIFSASMGEDPGYFGERVRRDRAFIAAAWRKRAEKLKLFARDTDIIGALDVAGELLRRPGKKSLYVLSDSMNSTKELNLEKPPRRPGEFLGRLKSIRHFPDLKGVSVHWLGAGGVIDMNHYGALALFWKSLIEERSGGRLEQFTSMREVEP
jgi:hypothetical protein